MILFFILFTTFFIGYRVAQQVQDEVHPGRKLIAGLRDMLFAVVVFLALPLIVAVPFVLILAIARWFHDLLLVLPIATGMLLIVTQTAHLLILVLAVNYLVGLQLTRRELLFTPTQALAAGLTTLFL